MCENGEKMTGKEKLKKTASAIIALLFYLLIVKLFLSKPFYTNDQVLMRGIANGSYTGLQDGHLVYIIYPLSGILSFLYKLLPRIDWYDLLVYAALLIASLLFSIVLEFLKKHFEQYLPNQYCFCIC